MEREAQFLKDYIIRVGDFWNGGDNASEEYKKYERYEDQQVSCVELLKLFVVVVVVHWCCEIKIKTET